MVEERLTELADSGVNFTGLTMDRELATALVARDGEIEEWGLGPELEQRGVASQPYPAIPFDAVDIPAVADRVRTQSGECGERDYFVEVQALTPSAILTTVRCDANRTTTDRPSPIVALLNDERLPTFGEDWDVSDWQGLLHVVGVLAPGMQAQQLRVTPDDASVWLADQSATNGCRPAVALQRDGGDVGWLCLGDEGVAADFSSWDAGQLHAATQEAAENANIEDREAMSSTVEAIPGGVRVLVGQDGRTGSVELTG